jgi:apolipoprotein N-acyltransferase
VNDDNDALKLQMPMFANLYDLRVALLFTAWQPCAMTRPIPYLTLLLAFVCGSLMQYAFSPFDLWWLGIVLPAVVLWLAQQKSPFLHGYAFGIGWFGVGAWWLVETIHHYGGLPYPVAIAMIALIGVVMGLFPALWFSISHRLAHSTLHLLYIFPAVAVLLEWLRGHLFTGLPWTAWGNTMIDTHAASWAAYVGVYGLAALPACWAVILLLLVQRQTRPALLAALFGLTLWWLAPTVPTDDQPVQHAALIQGNIQQDQKWDSTFLRQTLETYVDLSARQAGKVDVIIWPESAVPFFPSRMPEWDQWLQQQMAFWHTPVLYGGDRLLTGDQAQSGIYAWQQGERTFVGKHHLVPFGEYVPAWLPFVHAIIPAIADFKPADDDGVLHTSNTRFGSLVCYESIFPEEARSRVLHGAQALIVASNDAWYGRSPAVWQHTQAARMRAVETGRWLLRVGSTGITTVIAPDGTMKAQLPWWQADALLAPFHNRDHITRYVQWGDWPALIFAMLLLFVPLWRQVRSNRSDA